MAILHASRASWLLLSMPLLAQLLSINALQTNKYLSVKSVTSVCKTAATAALLSSFLANPLSTQAAVDTPLYGIVKGRLRVCPAISNCISTASFRSLDKYGKPWVYSSDTETIWTALKQELASNALFKVVETKDDIKYIHAEARSALPPTGVDDVEFLLIPEDSLVTYRSNSREVVFAGTAALGDGGSHANRLLTIRKHLKLQEMGVDAEDESFYREQQNPGFLDKLKTGFGYIDSKPADINFLDNSVPLKESPVPINTAIP